MIMWYDFFVSYCTDFNTCSELVLGILSVIFVGGPMLSISNMILPWYIIISLVFGGRLVSYYFIGQRYRHTVFLLRGWNIGVLLFWIMTAIWHHHGFPLYARELPSCGACGSDYPPYSSLLPTIGNIIISQIMGYGIAYIVGWSYHKKGIVILTIISFFVILQGFAFLALLFD